MVDEGAQAHGFDGLALGAAEVRAEDDLGAVAERVLNGRKGLGMRVSSVMMPSLMGTLKSTRMRTRLSVSWVEGFRSRMESFGM